MDKSKEERKKTRYFNISIYKEKEVLTSKETERTKLVLKLPEDWK